MMEQMGIVPIKFLKFLFKINYYINVVMTLNIKISATRNLLVTT